MTKREMVLARALVDVAMGVEPEIAYTREGDEWLVIGGVRIQTRTAADRDWSSEEADLAIPRRVLVVEIG